MRGLMSIFKVRFNLQLQYRAAAYAGVFCQVFFGFVMVMMYEAFYSGGITDLPMTLTQTVTYIWLGQGLLGLLPWNGDREVQGTIRNGDVAYELVRPMNLYWFWYFKIMAQRLAPTLLRSVPLFLIAVFIMPDMLRMSGPADMIGFACFMVVLLGAIVLGSTVSNIITISTLFTIGDGMDRLFPALVTLGSGLVIPLAFFPDWSQIIFRLLPFSGLSDAPYRFYLGVYTVSDLPFVLIHQITWTIILALLGQFMLQKASQRIIVQGG